MSSPRGFVVGGIVGIGNAGMLVVPMLDVTGFKLSCGSEVRGCRVGVGVRRPGEGDGDGVRRFGVPAGVPEGVGDREEGRLGGVGEGGGRAKR